MFNDRRQERLLELFEELRYIKQHWLAEQMPDPIGQAIHDEEARAAIRQIEERIEEEMNGGGMDQRQGEAAGEKRASAVSVQRNWARICRDVSRIR